jgi:hypothetical protein
MSRRKITDLHVRTVYESYETAVPARLGRRNYFRAFPQERRVLRITVAETSAGPLVVTVAEIPIK